MFAFEVSFFDNNGVQVMKQLLSYYLARKYSNNKRFATQAYLINFDVLIHSECILRHTIPLLINKLGS
ncbi:hypothetical protein RJT34_14145 [Clitoria ternatea]|uniref:Uncharacterized protein n=1 Tax=Clitoria ternatea TaxID=43366 RepID=A0AAN9PMH1_CLITE